MTDEAPVRPGQYISETYLEELGLSGRQLAGALGVAPSTVSRLLRGDSSITGEMALRLSAALDTSPDLWMSMQKEYDLWEALKHVDIAQVHSVLKRSDEDDGNDSGDSAPTR